LVGSSRGWGRGRISYPRLCNLWGALPLLRNIKYTRMYYIEKKVLKFSPQRSPAKMFFHATLWLSTGLSLHVLVLMTIDAE